MSIRMPGKKPSPEEFVAGATAAVPSPAPIPPELPWLDPKVRDDLRVQVNGKLPEKLMLQVNWLANRLGIKKQDMLEMALRDWAQARMKELGMDDN
jgi:hypothetical protein